MKGLVAEAQRQPRKKDIAQALSHPRRQRRGFDPRQRLGAFPAQPLAVGHPIGQKHRQQRVLRVAPLQGLQDRQQIGHAQRRVRMHECFLDELAVAGGLDPLAIRLALTADYPFAQAVLEAVGELSRWGTPLSADDGRRRGRGLAMSHSFGSTVAQVIEVSAGDDPDRDGIRIEQVYCVADVGLARDPGIVTAQMQSGILYGLSAAVMGEISFRGGRVEQSNFHNYGALRLAQCPEIQVRILESGDAPTGVGEPAPGDLSAGLGGTGQTAAEAPHLLTRRPHWTAGNWAGRRSPARSR